MEIKTLGSGSSGNCHFLKVEGKILILDAGVHINKISEALGNNYKDVEMCFISHEHKDHCKAVPDLLKKDVPCAMTLGTKKALKKEIGNYAFMVKVLTRMDWCKKENFKVMSFNVNHDAEDPCGFFIVTKNNQLAYITDTNYPDYGFQNLTHIMIECNYDKEQLDRNFVRGIITQSQRLRIINNHFEMSNVLTFLTDQNLRKVQEIHLMHLSKDNINPDYAKSYIKKGTRKNVLIAREG